MDARTSRAACAYCGTQARPNAMYCMQCGQIVIAAPPAQASPPTSPVFAPVASASAAPAARAAVDPYLLPAANVPALPREPHPSAVPEPQPVAPPPVPRLAHLDAQHIELEFTTGERVGVVSTAVLGRRPEATAHNSGAQAVVVPDDTKSVSRAHAVIEVQGRAATISDAGSANGTAVERAGSAVPLRSGDQVSLSDGDRIWLGSVPVLVHISQTSRGAHA